MAGYTQGEWKVTYIAEYDSMYGEIGAIVNVTLGDRTIPITHKGWYSPTNKEEKYKKYKEQPANAFLMAAAPDMHEVLQDTPSNVEVMLRGEIISADNLREWYCKAQNANTKAIGGCGYENK